jgi:GDPmannose 4,6-dehydratase
VRVSFDIPEYTGDVTGLGTARLLEAIRETRIETKFYNAASSEMFGNATEVPRTVGRLVSEHFAGTHDHCSKLYSLTIFQQWHAKYLQDYGQACRKVISNCAN